MLNIGGLRDRRSRRVTFATERAISQPQSGIGDLFHSIHEQQAIYQSGAQWHSPHPPLHVSTVKKPVRTAQGSWIEVPHFQRHKLETKTNYWKLRAGVFASGNSSKAKPRTGAATEASDKTIATQSGRWAWRENRGWNRKGLGLKQGPVWPVYFRS